MQRYAQLTTLLLGSTLLVFTGCKKTATARNDQQIQDDIQSKLAADNGLQGQNIGVVVADRVATLSGTANNDGVRTLAASDAGSVDGVKTVVNDLTTPVEQPECTPPPKPVRAHLHIRHKHAQPVMDAAVPPPPPSQEAEAPAPPQQPARVVVVTPPPAPVYVVRPFIYPRPVIYPYGVWRRRYIVRPPVYVRPY